MSTSISEPLREVLDNGIVLLGSESRETRTVAIRASFPSGSVRETEAQAGLAAFTARLLRRGTLRHSAQEISGTVEDLGASFGVWSGSEALNLKLVDELGGLSYAVKFAATKAELCDNLRITESPRKKAFAEKFKESLEGRKR